MDELKDKIKKAQEEGSIASLFTLESRVLDCRCDELVADYYAMVLDIAMENLTDALENIKVFDMSNVEDFATLKALYEYALEHFSEKNYQDGSALFEMIGGMCDDESFKESMKAHKIACDRELDIDDFLSNYADIDLVDKFYINQFKKALV